ncbi:MAG TPA: non-homologous end-joining DNA ligase [Nitrospirota bacterium]|nr:non-homologous end-joining DNA ligase [Nitrospirota bacterium]
MTVVQTIDRKIALSNLDKDLYPSFGFTKAAVLDYYRRIAPLLLPHLNGRALTLKRYPDGVSGKSFYEKRCPNHRPAWMRTAEVPQDHGAPINFCVIDDLESLLWVANLASLELHVPLARAASSRTPDSLVFDLDPGEGAGVLECGRAALILRELLAGLNLSCWVKSTGRKGLHVFVPLNREETTFDATKLFTKSVAVIMQKHYPELVTANMPKAERRGRVFINWSQNDASKTMISVYSLRAEEKPFVSCPLEWSEVESAVKNGDPAKLRVVSSEALNRISEQGDLFRDLSTKKQALPHL